jgi:hypothetical protein
MDGWMGEDTNCYSVLLLDNGQRRRERERERDRETEERGEIESWV